MSNTKKIHFDFDDFVHVEDNTLLKMVCSGDDVQYRKVCEIGDVVCLGKSENLRTGSTRWFFAPEKGIPGNMNPNIYTTEGWRGTTNDVSVTAHGLWKVVGFKELKKPKGVISVELKRFSS